MTTRAIHEALRVMRFGLKRGTERFKIIQAALEQLEALEKELHSIHERGTTRGSVLLESIVKAPPTYFVIAVGAGGKAEDFWPVTSEDEGREQAKEQSRCEGQQNWGFRVYRGDALIGVYRRGEECAPPLWAAGKKGEEPQVSPSVLKAKSYHVFISTETGVHKDSVVVGSEAEALEYHKAHGTQPSLKGCVFRAYEMTPSGQRTLLATFKHGVRLKG